MLARPTLSKGVKIVANYEVWSEGFLATGMNGRPAPAKLLATVEADSFSGACDKLLATDAGNEAFGPYDRERRTVWGCRLFDNEADARRAFG